MNLDLTINRMSIQETDSLLVRQVLIARRRAELNLETARTSVEESGDSTGAGLDRALKNPDDKSSPPVRDTMRRVDKWA